MNLDSRKAALERYAELRRLVEDALRRHDPVQLISTGAPPDEYDPEVGTILPRLEEASNVIEVQDILHQEFTEWFGAVVAGPRELYSGAAIDIWHGWLLVEAQRLASEPDVELVDPSKAPVRFGSDALDAATIIRIDRRFFVETKNEPGKWWMGERRADGQVTVWGQYGPHQNAFAQH